MLFSRVAYIASGACYSASAAFTARVDTVGLLVLGSMLIVLATILDYNEV